MSVGLERRYYRPVPCPRDLPQARPIGGGRLAFREIDVLCRTAPPERLPVDAVLSVYPDAEETLMRISAPRVVLGHTPEQPLVMAVLNATPDSFSDGGKDGSAEAAVMRGLALAAAGADILDIGGESTRPGAAPVDASEETDRVLPVIEGLVRAGCPIPISVDTRRAAVARAALDAGACVLNDVSALTFDPGMSGVARDAETVCLMHANGTPETMQDNPHYDNVLLDIFDYLEFRVAAAQMSGLYLSDLMVDPGIGFGKTIGHNLALIAGLSILHGLGCPVLLGVSRKGFIGRLSGQAEAARRAPGSIAAGLAGVAQGAHVLRVHDVEETIQALRVWDAIAKTEGEGA